MIDALAEIFRAPNDPELQSRTVLVPAKYAEQIAATTASLEGYEAELMPNETEEDIGWAMAAHVATIERMMPLLGYAGEDIYEIREEGCAAILSGEARVLRIAPRLGASAVPTHEELRPFEDDL